MKSEKIAAVHYVAFDPEEYKNIDGVKKVLEESVREKGYVPEMYIGYDFDDGRSSGFKEMEPVIRKAVLGELDALFIAHRGDVDERFIVFMRGLLGLFDVEVFSLEF